MLKNRTPSDERKERSIKTIILRLKEIKKNLETSDYTSIGQASRCLRDPGSSARLGENGLKVIKRIEGIHHWVGGEVDRKMAEKFYNLINSNRKKNKTNSRVKKTYKKRIKQAVVEIEEEPQTEQAYNNEDVVKMIEEFTNAAFEIKQEIVNFKAEMHDYTRAIKDLESRVLRSENVNLQLVQQISKAS